MKPQVHPNHPLWVLTRDVRVRWPLCQQCDCAETKTRKDLRRTLAGLAWEAGVLDAGRRRRDGFEPRFHQGHRVVKVEGRVIDGPRIAPAMQAILRALDPELVRPIERFRGERSPLNQAIVAEYRQRGLGDVFDAEMRGAIRVRLGKRGDGAMPIEDLARTPVVRRSAWRENVLTQVVIESGVTMLANLKQVWKDEFERLLDAPGHDRGQALRDHGWIVLGRYIDLLKHHPDFHRVRMKKLEPARTPDMLAVCEALPMAPAARADLIGDVALLEFDACRRTALFPEVASLSALMGVLEARGYLRLAVAPPQGDDRQRLEALVKDMARAMDHATVIQVDFGPVFEAFRFEHQPKKRKP